MMEQARLMMEQARQEQLKAQQSTVVAPSADGYTVKEVDRLRSEMDGMRDTINKLTASLAQAQEQVRAQAQTQGIPNQPVYRGDDYRRLEQELDRMRREIAEKEIKEKERELERKQREAENAVKDIRPEMIQLSDSSDMPIAAPVMPGGATSEYITLADGVVYSTKDKQVYVMTPASKAAIGAVQPTPAAKPAAVQKRAVKKPAPKKAVKRAPSKKHRAPAPRSRGGRPARRPSGRPTRRR